MENKPTLLFVLTPYTAISGGSVLLHYWCSMMHAAGYPVVSTEVCHFNPLVQVRKKPLLDDIVIYPDCFPGNPLGASRIVRFFGAYPGNYFKGKIKENECVIANQEEFVEGIKHLLEYKRSKIMVATHSCVDTTMCFRETKTIDNLFYGSYAGKRGYCIMPPLLDEYEILPKAYTSDDHYKTLALLRRTKNFFTTDINTRLCNEAALCGCNVLVWHNRTWRNETEKHLTDTKWFINPARDKAAAHRDADYIYSFFNNVVYVPVKINPLRFWWHKLITLFKLQMPGRIQLKALAVRMGHGRSL